MLPLSSAATSSQKESNHLNLAIEEAKSSDVSDFINQQLQKPESNIPSATLSEEQRRGGEHLSEDAIDLATFEEQIPPVTLKLEDDEPPGLDIEISMDEESDEEDPDVAHDQLQWISEVPSPSKEERLEHLYGR